MGQSSRLTFVVAITCLVTSIADAQKADTTVASPSRLALAHRVLEASGTIETMVAAMRANLPAQRMASPQIPAEFWTRFEVRITSDVPQLVDSIAVLYAKRFSQDDLQGMLAFYQSPVGRRVRELQPGLVTESSAIGQRWGMRIGAEIGAALQQQQPPE
jgi:uncharacterized protein